MPRSVSARPATTRGTGRAHQRHWPRSRIALPSHPRARPRDPVNGSARTKRRARGRSYASLPSPAQQMHGGVRRPIQHASARTALPSSSRTPCDCIMSAAAVTGVLQERHPLTAPITAGQSTTGTKAPSCRERPQLVRRCHCCRDHVWRPTSHSMPTRELSAGVSREDARRSLLANGTGRGPFFPRSPSPARMRRGRPRHSVSGRPSQCAG